MSEKLPIICIACGTRPVPSPGDLCRHCHRATMVCQTAISVEELIDAGGAVELMAAMSVSGYKKMIAAMYHEQEILA